MCIRDRGKDLYDNVPAAKELFEKANEILGFRITDIMFAGTDEELKQTRVTQPAVFLHSVIMAKALGVKPDAAAGHSLGEFSALVVAGALSFEDGLKLVSKRAMACLLYTSFKGHDTQVYNYPDMEFVPFSLASQHADNPYIHNVSGNGNLKFQGRPGANNTANIVFQGFSAGAFPEIDQWAFMQPVALNTISPDTGLNIKGVTDDLPSYSYTYTEPGTYTVTFIVAGGNYQGQSAPAPYEVTFTVIDPIE